MWARDKLHFLEKYLPGAVGATKKKRGHTHYVDLYAGPGRNAWVDSDGRYVDFPASPLIALGASFEFKEEERPQGFGHFHFCNIEPLDYVLLNERLDKKCEEIAEERGVGDVDTYFGDANDKVYEIIEEIPSWSYIAAFLDIQGPSNLAFETIEVLKSRHDSVDVYVLYPTGSLPRILPYDRAKREQYHDTLDRYFGTPEWRPIVERRRTDADAPTMDRELRELYVSQLERLWKHVDVTAEVKGPKGTLYHMLFAYDHPAAGNIAESSIQDEETGQVGLFEQPR